MPGRPSSLCTDAMLTMRPRWRATMRRDTAWPTMIMLSTLVRRMRCQASCGNSWKGARCVVPALLNRMSIGPTCCSTAATPASTPTLSQTSKGRTCTARPSACNVAAAVASLPASRPFSTTVAPAWPSARASAKPMPATTR
jgi:hypothetical protein